MRARGKRWWEWPVWMFPFPSLSFPHLPPSLSSNPWSLSTWNLGMEVMELKVADRFTLMDYLPPKGKACWTTSISTQWAVWVLSGVGAEAEWEWGLPVSLPLHGVEPWLLTLALLEPALGLPAHPLLSPSVVNFPNVHNFPHSLCELCGLGENVQSHDPSLNLSGSPTL